jgi:hypothetical protein
MFYRRNETVFSDNISYERVTYNRLDHSVTSELVLPRPDNQERLFEKGVLKDENGQVVHDHYVYDP